MWRYSVRILRIFWSLSRRGESWGGGDGEERNPRLSCTFFSSYESFVNRTQFGDNSTDFIKLEYYTDCAGQFPSLRQRNYCNNVQLGKEVEFFVDVTLTDYPKNGAMVSSKRGKLDF